MAIKCPKCHCENPSTVKFCGGCGTPLPPPGERASASTETFHAPVQELTTGATFAGRYQVIEELGHGGMGRVYKVFDTQIKEKIALKLIRPEVASDKDTIERFSNEIRLARRIGHRNVCRMFDIGEAEGARFITMEYVHGEDLKSMIHMSGSLSLGMLLSVGKQVCDGLAEAHALGVVHRDLKPQNIMIDKNGNAKIMDYGIARSVREKGITGPSVMIGTPEYMSPEQAEAKAVDPLSDIYSLGIILYEMATSHVPFEGDTALAIAMKHKGETPKNPRGLNPNIPADLGGVILKCLEKDKAKRYQSAADIHAELEKIEKGLPTTARFVPEHKPITSRQITVQFEPRKLFVPAVVLISAVVIGIVLWKVIPRKEAAPASKIRNSVAVISFENQTGDKAFDFLSKAIPTLLITGLEQRGGLHVVTWERMTDLLAQMGRKSANAIDQESGFRLCRKEGIEAIVMGSFVKAGDMFATDAKVLDVETKRLLKSAGSRGQGADSILRTQIDELSRDISAGLAPAGEKAKTAGTSIAGATTSSMEAYQAFLRGGDEFDKMYYDDARKSLERAVELDPEFALAYILLANVYGALGEERMAGSAIEKAKALAHKVTERERLYIEASYAGSIEKNREARIRLLQEIIRKYPREKIAHYWLGVIYRGANDFERAMEEQNMALELDPDYGEAHNELGYICLELRDFGKAIKHFQRYAALNPRDANPLDSLAEAYFLWGRLDEAIVKYKEALAIKPAFLTSNYCIAYIYALKEIPAEALIWVDAFIAQAPTAGLKGQGLAFKGFYQSWLGRLNEALESLDQAGQMLISVGDAERQALIFYYRALIYLSKGEFELARKSNDKWFDSLARQYPGWEAYYKGGYLGALALIDLKQGKIDSAEAGVAEMMSLLPRLTSAQEEMGLFVAALVQAELWLAESLPDRTIALFEKTALPVPPGMGEPFYILSYNTPFFKDVVARAFLQKGDLDRAIAEYEKLVTFDPASRTRFLVHPLYYLRLAKLYEQKGLKAKALERYQKFLELWKDADAGMPEVEDAKARLAGLKAN